MNVKKLRNWMGLGLLLGLGAGACAEAPAPGSPLAQWSGVSGGPARAQTLVLRSADAWQAWWRDRERDMPRALDPKTEMAVVVALGERRTGGYRVQFLSVREHRGQVLVRYRTNTPARGAAVMQMITHPWAVAIVARSGLPVVFQQLTPSGAAGRD